MSVDIPSTAAYTDKKNEIAQVVLSRKRKLIQLYTVATSADALPAFRPPPLDAPQTPALALFLLQNDIEHGRYFQDVTLPPRYQFASKLLPPHQLSSPHTKSPERVKSPPSLSFDATAQLPAVEELVTAKNLGGSLSSDSLHPLRNAQKQLATPQDQARSASSDADRPRTVMRLSGVVVDGSRTGSRHQSPRLTLQAEPYLARASLVNPSRPVSPPYSPGTEPPRAGLPSATDGLVTAGPDGPINVLTPRRDHQDVVEPHRNHSHHGGLEVTDHLPFNDQGDKTEHEQRATPGLETSILSAERTETSPSDTSRSAYTARTTAQSSTATSEEDISPQRAGHAREIPTPGDQSTEKVNGMEIVTQVQKQSSLQSLQRAIASESGRAPVEDETKMQPLQAGQRSVTASHTTTPPACAPVAEDALLVSHDESIRKILTPVESSNIAGKRRRTSPAEDGDQPNTVMNIKRQGASPHHVSSTTTSQLRSKDRVRKLRPRRGLRHMQFVLSKPSEDRYLDTMRALRKERIFKQMGTQSYFKPLIQHQVYHAENLNSMDHLLMGTSKTVTTSDFMANIREEQGLRVLERTKTLQNSLRWSLRQLKPSVEPPQPWSHWDVVLSNVKWLRTDFKEEAKFRTAVARTLAEWCAEFVAAQPNEKRTLRVKVRDSHEQQPAAQPRAVVVDAAALELAGVKRGLQAEWLSGDNGINYFAAVPGEAPFSLKALQLSDEFLSRVPLYKPGKQSRHMLDITLRANLEHIEAVDGSTLPISRRSIADQGRDVDDTDIDDDRDPPLPPEKTSCALFDPESRPLRARLTAPWIFKPPTAPMPPQTFYEHRSASQWNWEDDQLLKQYTKDFPSNWQLIADRMMPKSSFTTYIDRRTPWECYERLLAMEGPPADAQARQYLRHFSYRLEKARESFDKHQNAIREAAEQHAQNAGQPAPVLPQKRFPTPMRVDRKPNKRLLAMLDCARKLARKREQSAAKLQSQTQTEGQAQKAQQPRPPQNQTPQYFSRLKYEAEIKEQERLQSLRDQQRAILEAQRRPQAGQQAHLTNGIGQQMRQRVASGQANPNGQIPVTANNQTQVRQLPQQLNPPLSLANGISANAQLALAGRPQANMQAQQRLAPLINGQSASNVEAMRMVAQMQQQQRNYQLSQQQHNLQNQFARMSPNVTGATGLTSANMLAAFSNGSNSYPMGLQDGTGTPGLAPQIPNGTGSRVSPQVVQNATFQTSNQPQQLSSGHVTAINNLEHQIRSQNPNMSANDVRHLATVQLKQHMSSMQRQSAINGAMSAATGAHAQLPQTHPIMRSGGAGGNPQSPFPLAPQQQPVSTPQMQQTQPQQQGQSPYQTNNHLSTPSTLSSARAHSPVALSANMAGSPQLQPQQPQQSAYSAQLRQQMFAQQQAQRQHALLSANANAMAAASGSPPVAQHVSPAMGMAIPANFGGQGIGLNRTPSAQSLGSAGMLSAGGAQGQNQGQGSMGLGGSGIGQSQGQSMRPPSRSAGAMGLDPATAAQFQAAQQRVSPRPVSSGGFGGQ